MKKNVIAIVLSAILAAGNLSAVPVYAAESTNVAEAIEEVEQTETEDAHTSTKQDEVDVERDNSDEVTIETNAEDQTTQESAESSTELDEEESETSAALDNKEAAANDEIENSDDTNTSEQAAETEPGFVETDNNDGTENTDDPADEGEVFSLDFSFGFSSDSYFSEKGEWSYYSTLLSVCKNKYSDNGFYRNNEYNEVFIGAPSLTILRDENGTPAEIDGGTYDYVDLSKSHYLLVSYPIKAGYVPNRASVIKVNNKEVAWSLNNDSVQFSIPLFSGEIRSLAMEAYTYEYGDVAASSAIDLVIGDTYTLYPEDNNASISSVTASAPDIVKIEDGEYSNIIDLTGLKPGKVTVTVKGKNGSEFKIDITVKSILTASSITINSLSSKLVSLTDSDLYSLLWLDMYEYRVSTSNKNVATVTRTEDGIKVTGKCPGQATITVIGYGKYEETCTLKVKVQPALKSTTKTPSVTYGSTTISNVTTPGAKVQAKIGKKTYKATAGTNGKYTVKIPIVKIGTKIYMKFTYGGTSVSKTVTVKKSYSKVETTHWVYKNSTKVRGKATKVHAGDYIKVTINGKTYKKKITKAANSISFTITIKKPGKYGFRFKTELYNKFNQRLGGETEYVYKGDTVYVGDTKSTVRWLTGWNDPVNKNYYTYSEQWCYDWDGDGYHDAYLYFRNGKVTGWTIYD